MKSYLTKKIYIAGHKGMVGSAIWRRLEIEGANRLIGMKSSELDLRNQADVLNFFELEKPDIVIDAAAKVGGIMANIQNPYSFLMDNLMIQNNLIDGALKNDVETFVFLGSSCVYPKLAPQPLKEEYLLSGILEPTNEYYAIAKIAGIKACESLFDTQKKKFFSIMPSNLYGPHDNFDYESSHVLPALIRKFHDSKKNGNQPVKLWGSGNPRREFLHVNDLADAVVFLLDKKLNKCLINVGTGTDVTIKNLAVIIQDIVGHQGDIHWDFSKPDGTPRKVMNHSVMNQMGWEPKIQLWDGIKDTYKWYLRNEDKLKFVQMVN
ncbi:GDP-L-fucose synthase [Algoriphagus sp. C2-6-M1]|uniref:GDP-L-fucose synthase family protein n=1 Tax=Algoriphagus persicinus TaxID=3108754 RepID=UPI002B3E98C6|nr:GDP-L-fucose synthase [Algoriphagus sp. C2-6-M1]MEB2782613.1 GDP-L-fucose synthase [Algoriphagus sp. C2-6-M1]